STLRSNQWQILLTTNSPTSPVHIVDPHSITNCQIGVFAAYVSCHGHAFIDRALYLPREWTDDPDRLEAAYVPPDAGFAAKPKLATRMIARAIAASVPFKWVAGDTVYGVGDIEQRL